MVYFVIYSSSVSNYKNDQLINEIKQFPGWAILNTSSFLVATEESCNRNPENDLEQVKNKLWRHCGEEDKLFIGHFGSFAIWEGFDSRIRSWLIQYATSQSNNPNRYSQTVNREEDEHAED